MVEYILDTDIGSDCDDAGAIGVLHSLERIGECKALAMTSCLSRESAPACINAINRYYGKGDIPIGRLPFEGYNPEEIKHPYTDIIQQEFVSSFPKGSECESSIALIRRTLAESVRPIALCAIGTLTNIRFLLESQPDDISPLNGTELVREKVYCLYAMCGDFSEQHLNNVPEFNIRCDIESAQYVFRHFPAKIEILPFEIGRRIYAGALLLQNGKKENPVRRCYEIYCNSDRETWDLLTALLMVRPNEEYWAKSETGNVSIDDNGRSFFTYSESGKCRYIKGITREHDVKNLLEVLISEP